MTTTHRTSSPEETQEIANDLGRELSGGATVALHGDVGAGKTLFAQCIGRALGVEERMRSPSFTIVAEYPLDGTAASRLVHIDLYRTQSDDEVALLGLEDVFTEDTVAIVEWADRASWALPAGSIWVSLTVTGPTSRSIRIERPGN